MTPFDFPFSPCERLCYRIVAGSNVPIIGDIVFEAVRDKWKRKYHRDTVGRALARLVREKIMHNDGCGYSTHSVVILETLRRRRADDIA